MGIRLWAISTMMFATLLTVLLLSTTATANPYTRTTSGILVNDFDFLELSGFVVPSSVCYNSCRIQTCNRLFDIRDSDMNSRIGRYPKDFYRYKAHRNFVEDHRDFNACISTCARDCGVGKLSTTEETKYQRCAQLGCEYNKGLSAARYTCLRAGCQGNFKQ